MAAVQLVDVKISIPANVLNAIKDADNTCRVLSPKDVASIVEAITQKASEHMCVKVFIAGVKYEVFVLPDDEISILWETLEEIYSINSYQRTMSFGGVRLEDSDTFYCVC